jgi:hypothetical protein
VFFFSHSNWFLIPLFVLFPTFFFVVVWGGGGGGIPATVGLNVDIKPDIAFSMSGFLTCDIAVFMMLAFGC